MASRPALAALLTVLVALAAACSESTSASYGFVHVDSGGGGDIQIDGVAFEIDSSVHFLYHSESRSPGTTTSLATVDGHEFGLRDGQVFVGEQVYGPAAPGARVRITSAGVEIDGEMRGQLPVTREE